MLIAKPENGTFVVADFRSLFPETSFPNHGPDAEWLAQNNCYLVGVYKPHDPRTHKLAACQPYLEGNLVFTIQVEPKTAEELEFDRQNEANNVRMNRSKRLAQTDWVVLRALEKNEPVPAAWGAYRQALRDVPLQSGFPFDVQWPDEP